MPFYEYECQACKFYTEVMQKITDAPLRKCPSCGKLRLKKLVSAPVFRLKGAGWYETDFKSDKENRRNLLGPDKEEAKAEVKAEAKAEVKDKPETKDAKPAEAKAPAAPDKAPAAEKERASAGSAAAASRRGARRPARRSPASRARPTGRRKGRR
jgi:putative FmdB family regulatory protein